MPDKIATESEYAIEVDDVIMIFNMASKNLGSLKKCFIKLMKHELFFKEFRVLKHISFKIPKGSIVGLVGINVSGKSTVLKTMGTFSSRARAPESYAATSPRSSS